MSIRLAFSWGLLVLVTSSAMAESRQPTGLILTWQQDPTTTMTVDWHTEPDHPGDTIVSYQADGDDRWLEADGTRDTYPYSEQVIHRVELTGLAAGTAYRFRVGDFERVYQFRTMPDQLDESMTFAVGGDTWYSDETFGAMNRTVLKHEPAFIVWGGDLAYADGNEANRDRWLEWLEVARDTLVTEQGRVVPIVTAIGNHEMKRARGGNHYWNFDDYEPTDTWRRANAPYFFRFFAFPGQPGYGVLDFGDYLSLLILDSNHANAVSGDQKRWLESTLAQRQDVMHVLPIYHVPAYPVARDFEGPASRQIREHWIPLFEQANIDLAFESHDHIYKRTKPIRGGVVDPAGIVYIGDGAWGVETRPIRAGDAWYVAHAQRTHYAAIVRLTGDQKHVQIIGRDGAVIDEHPQSVPADAAAADERVLFDAADDHYVSSGGSAVKLTRPTQHEGQPCVLLEVEPQNGWPQIEVPVVSDDQWLLFDRLELDVAIVDPGASAAGVMVRDAWYQRYRQQIEAISDADGRFQTVSIPIGDVRQKIDLRETVSVNVWLRNPSEPARIYLRAIRLAGRDTSSNAVERSVARDAEYEAFVNPPAGTFSIGVIPDTQRYLGPGSGRFDEDGEVRNPAFDSRTRWLAEHLESQRIVFVTHVGDMVDQLEPAQFMFARRMMDRFADRVPYGISPGNHDTYGGYAAMFQQYFGADRYRDEPWYGGSFEADPERPAFSGDNVNSYQLFSAEGLDFIIVHLECNAPDNVLDWANEVLRRHRDRMAIVTTHMYLGPVEPRGEAPHTRRDVMNNDRELNLGRQTYVSVHGKAGNTSVDLWEKCFRKHPNLFLVLCGHESGVIAHHQTSRGDHGNIVHEVLQDYPRHADDADWLRLLRFDPARGKIRVWTYSPARDRLCTGLTPLPEREAHQFELDIAAAIADHHARKRPSP